MKFTTVLVQLGKATMCTPLPHSHPWPSYGLVVSEEPRVGLGLSKVDLRETTSKVCLCQDPKECQLVFPRLRRWISKSFQTHVLFCEWGTVAWDAVEMSDAQLWRVFSLNAQDLHPFTLY